MIPLKIIGNSLYTYRRIIIRPASDGGLPCPAREWVLLYTKPETPEQKTDRITSATRGIARLRDALNDKNHGAGV